MHVRRAVLLFALVLGLTALAAAVSPSRHTRKPPGAVSVSPPATSSGGQTLALTVPPTDPPPERVARPGEQIILTVSVRAAGSVTIPRLGRIDSATPNAPARFDLLAPDPGRYDVIFQPPVGARIRAGTLVTRR